MEKKPPILKNVPNVTIMGAGEIGRAVNHLLMKKGLAPNVWDRDPKKNLCQQPLEETLPRADFLFLCIPSWCLADALDSIKHLLKRKTIIISVSKGIERSTGKTINELLKGCLPKNQPFALLAGPMLAEEILQDLGASAVAASDSPKARRSLAELFSGSDLNIQPSADLAGVALAGVLKNVYAISMGIADGLGWGINRRGWLTARAASEMMEILHDQKADPKTMLTSAGLADLISTGFSKYSSNHQTGINLAKHVKGAHKSEGAMSLPPLMKRLGAKSKKYSLLNTTAGVLLHRKNADKAFEQYFHETH